METDLDCIVLRLSGPDVFDLQRAFNAFEDAKVYYTYYYYTTNSLYYQSFGLARYECETLAWPATCSTTVSC